MKKLFQVRRCSTLKPDLVRVKHMLEAAQEIISFTSKKKRADLDLGRKLSLSIIRHLEIMGEAAGPKAILKAMRRLILWPMHIIGTIFVKNGGDRTTLKPHG